MLELNERDRAMLGGEFGAGVALAMRVVSRTAGVMAAGRWVREPGAPRSAAGQADPEPDPAGCACAGPSA